MGGGDLNLKKSWHPQTLRNIERVWKAEQKYEAEQKKIEQLRKELQEERSREEIRHFAEDQGVLKKKNERLDWMYAGPASHINREEYLLGRPADRALELLNNDTSEKDDQVQPGAIFVESTCNSAVDLATKIREDPLFAIRKREEESKKELLNNPIRLKQLQQLLKAKLDKTEKKKLKKKKKNKKHTKQNYSASENESTHLLKCKKQKKSKVSKKSSDNSSRENQKEKFQCINNTHEIARQYKRHDSSNSSDDSTHKESRPEGYGLMTKNGFRSRSPSPKIYEKLGRYSRSNSKSPKRQGNSRASKYEKTKHSQTYMIDYKQWNPYPKSVVKLSRYSRSHSRSPPKRQENSRSSRSESLSYTNGHKQKNPSLKSFRKLSRNSGRSSRSPSKGKESSKADHNKANHSQKHSRSSPVDDKYGKKYHFSPSSERKSGSRSPISTSSQHRNSSSSQSSKSKKKKLDANEMKRLREEMMDNAKWRDEQLIKKVKEYREEVSKEEEYLKHREQDAKFIIPMLKAAASSTVENRIKRNIYNVQRTKVQEDHFLKR